MDGETIERQNERQIDEQKIRIQTEEYMHSGLCTQIHSQNITIVVDAFHKRWMIQLK